MTTLLDVHTHTIASGHSFSTLSEMIAEAQRKGLKLFGVTEHTDSIPSGCHPVHFRNYHVIPRQYGDMRLLMGAELNILDTTGRIDLSEEDYRRLDIRIAGIHGYCWKGGTVDENTAGVINAIRNPWVHIISHPGDGTAQMHFEPVVLAAKESHTLLEINNASFKPARHKDCARPNNLEILKLCKKYEVPVVLGSDAHIVYDVANYEFVLPLLQEVEFPPQLILNDKPEAFLKYTGIK